MLAKILQGTGFVLCMMGAMAVNEANPWYVPTTILWAGALLLVWGCWEEGLIPRWLSERRRRRWSHRR